LAKPKHVDLSALRVTQNIHLYACVHACAQKAFILMCAITIVCLYL